MTNPDKLIEALIISNKSLITATEQTNVNVRELTDSVNELIVDRAVRVQQDVSQQEVNKKMIEFIDKNALNMARLDNWYKIQNKVASVVLAAIVFAAAKLMGFEWK